MLLTNVRYGYNDVMIQPCAVSEIEHRSECNPFIDKVSYLKEEYDMLPIFAAPMSTVVDLNNYSAFYKNHIYAIIPRNIDWELRKEHIVSGDWVAVSLKEFEEYICNKGNFNGNYMLRILIDVANGNMSKIFELARKAKEMHKEHITIMAGNIANVDTYWEYCESGIDYCRASIGTGSCCITASNTSIGDGIASLLNDLYTIKNGRNKKGLFCTKIIADGGVRGFCDVIKSLGLGSDYVMIGGLFASCLESAGEIYTKDMLNRHYPINRDNIIKEGDVFLNKEDNTPITLYKECYGMASKYGQIAINGKKTKTSEGIKKEMKITTDLPTWSDNMCAYLRSAMSYCGLKDVKEFNPLNVKVQVISNNVKESINK